MSAVGTINSVNPLALCSTVSMPLNLFMLCLTHSLSPLQTLAYAAPEVLMDEKCEYYSRCVFCNKHDRCFAFLCST